MSFFSDNLPVIKLGSWSLNADLFASDIMLGPVPTLFAEDPEQALASILSDAVRAHADLQRLARCFYTPEMMDPPSALKYLKAPRNGAAIFPYKVPAWRGPEQEESNPGPSLEGRPGKRARIAQPPEPGKILLLSCSCNFKKITLYGHFI